MEKHITSVLFVCLGNICRSPLAQGVFEHKLVAASLEDTFHIDSCGTGGWHTGKKPHHGSIAIAAQYGIGIENQRARQLEKEDLTRFDWILAMDSDNLSDIRSVSSNISGRIHLLREFDPSPDDFNVPDPYYTGNFQHVYEILDRSCDRLLDEIRKTLS